MHDPNTAADADLDADLDADADTDADAVRPARPGRSTRAAAVRSEGEFYGPLRGGLHGALARVEERLREIRDPHDERVSLLAARNLIRAASNCLVRAERRSRGVRT